MFFGSQFSSRSLIETRPGGSVLRWMLVGGYAEMKACYRMVWLYGSPEE
jgi:hypothetical protein